MRKRLILSALLVLLGGARASAQFAVIDVANLAENSWTALQSTLTTVEAIFHSTQWVLELTPTEGLVVGDIGEDLAALGDIVAQAEGLSYDIQQLQAQINDLFNLDTAPDTSGLLKERLLAIRLVKFQCHTYAMKTQALLATAARTAEHMMGLVDAILGYMGNLSAHQKASEGVSVLNKSLANLQVQTAAYQRGESVERMEKLLIAESMARINNRIFDR